MLRFKLIDSTYDCILDNIHKTAESPKMRITINNQDKDVFFGLLSTISFRTGILLYISSTISLFAFNESWSFRMRNIALTHIRVEMANNIIFSKQYTFDSKNRKFRMPIIAP
jgi:hypothetical protein